MNDEMAFEALRKDVLNLSAYSKEIQEEVEDKTFKDVQKQSIVVSLARLREEIQTLEPLTPNVKANNIYVKTELSSAIFKTSARENLNIIRSTPKSDPNNKEYLTITQGVNEATVVTTKPLFPGILEIYASHGFEPIHIEENVTVIALKFDENYIETPNVVYAILKALAMKKINLLDINTTHNEISLTINQSSLQEVINILSNSF